MFLIIPVEVDSTEDFAIPVNSEGIKFFEMGDKVVYMLLSNVFDFKIINY